MDNQISNLNLLFNFDALNQKKLCCNNFINDDFENTNFADALENSRNKLEEKIDQEDSNALSTIIPLFNPFAQAKGWVNEDFFSNFDFNYIEDERSIDAPTPSLSDSIKNISKSQTDTNLTNSSNPKNAQSDIKSIANTITKKPLRDLFAVKTTSFMPFNIFSMQEFIRTLQDRITKLDIKSISSKIIDKVKLIKDGEKTDLTIDLKPEWLGSLILKISSDKGILNINIFANNTAKDLLDSNIGELEKSLKDANLNIGNLEVSIGGQSQNEQNKFMPMDFAFSWHEDEKLEHQKVIQHSNLLENVLARQFGAQNIYSKI